MYGPGDQKQARRTGAKVGGDIRFDRENEKILSRNARRVGRGVSFAAFGARICHSLIPFDVQFNDEPVSTTVALRQGGIMSAHYYFLLIS